MFRVSRTVLLFMMLQMSTYAAANVILFPKPQSETDIREQYPKELLIAALDATKAKYGGYVLRYSERVMSRERSYAELRDGKLLHVRVSASKEKWEKNLLPIYFPVMRGLIGYGVMLVRQADVDKFKKMKSLDEIKKLRLGLGQDWSVTPMYRSQGFYVVTGKKYEGLFEMLIRQRFDFFIRGTLEILQEYEQRKVALPQLAIEKSKLFIMPLPVYFFVSPTRPKLAKRVEEGLKILDKKGEINKAFMKFFGSTIKTVNMKSRTIYRFDNPTLSKKSREAWNKHRYKIK